MIPDLFWIPGPWRGKLAVATRPRGGDWLQDEIAGWRAAGLDIVLSLLEDDESIDLGLKDEASLSKASGLSFLSFPIPDRGVPDSLHAAQDVFRSIKTFLDQGRNVAVHCRQGIGRSGLVAAGVMITTGIDIEDAVKTVSSARGLSIPETAVQLDWLRRLPTRDLVSAS